MIPENTKESLHLYVNSGLRPGHFLEAVLSNDLFGAVSHADSQNSAALVEIVRYVYNELPTGAYGSHEKIRAWIDRIHSVNA